MVTSAIEIAPLWQIRRWGKQMAKKLRKAFQNLDRRISAWQATLKTLPIGANPLAYRKPGSMKRK